MDETEIAVTVAGICGSDLAAYLGNSRRRTAPMVLGHELTGCTSAGKRVVANPFIVCGHCSACLSGACNLCTNWRLLGMDQTAGCHAEFVSLPGSQLYPIPDSLPDACAVLAEPLANVVHLFRIAAPQPSIRMGIVGTGTMGSMALLTALHMGIREVLALDVSEPRVQAARHMGAAAAVHVQSEAGHGEALRLAGSGLDLVLDAAGTAEARQTAFDLCRPGGLVVLLGMSQKRSEIDFVSSIYKEHRVAMSFAYTPEDFKRSLEMLTEGHIDLRAWTAEMPLEEGQQAFERMAANPGDTLKMLLRVR